MGLIEIAIPYGGCLKIEIASFFVLIHLGLNWLKLLVFPRLRF